MLLCKLRYESQRFIMFYEVVLVLSNIEVKM